MIMHHLLVLLTILTISLTLPHTANASSESETKHLEFKLNPSPVHNDNSVDCMICESLIGTILNFLNGSHAENEIENAIDVICEILPEKPRSTCIDLAHRVANFLVMLPKLADMQDYSPYALCSMYEYCTVECCISDLPEQVHLSFGDNRTLMAATWTTKNRDGAEIYYGVSPNALNMKVTGETHTYTNHGWLGWIHSATMTDLKPNTQYFYKVGYKNSFSKVFNFYTEKNFVENQTPSKVIVYGDMGANAVSDQMISRLQNIIHNHEADFIIHDGDISYADGFQQRWDIFMRKIEPVAAYTPYMVTPGNHEIGIIGLLDTTLGYPHRFSLPGKYALSNDLENLYYSYNYANMHIISIDTESIEDTAKITTQQYNWIENDLKSVDREKYPWVIVYGHRPLYCSNHGSDCGSGIFAVYLRTQLEDLFYKYKVDLIFMAHKHDYERMYPVYKNQATLNYNNPGKPTYVLNGAGGNREGVQHFPEDRPNWSASAISEWGYGIMTVYNRTVLKWEFITANNNKVADTFTLVVNH